MKARTAFCFKSLTVKGSSCHGFLMNGWYNILYVDSLMRLF